MSDPHIISSRDVDLGLAKELARANAALWSETYLRTESGTPFSFADHPYQIEPLSVEPPQLTVQKARQLGFTLLCMAHYFHAMVTGRIKTGFIHLFPTADKVAEFSETRWTPLLRANPVHLMGRVHTTNNKHNKRIATANLMFRGARLSQRIQGVADDSPALRGDPTDGCLFDEYDLISPLAHELAMDGALHSELRWDWAISNPTVPNYGIEKRFLEGDQRYWMIRCDACNSWWAEWIEVPLLLRRQPDGSVNLACLRCGRPLDPRRGQWVAKYPERSRVHMSYRISQLARPQRDLAHLLDAWENPPDGDRAGVMRFKFGRSYIDATCGLSAADVLLRCQAWPMLARSGVATALGADVGRDIHVVIGQRIGPEAYRILALLLCRDWQELKRCLTTYQVQVGSIDNEPEIRQARLFQQEAGAAGTQIWLSDYVEMVGPASYDQKVGLIRVNRNEILDNTHYTILTPGKLQLPAPNALVQMFAAHCANMTKVVEKDPRTGALHVSYLQTGPDHFRHAFANFLLAAHLQVATIADSTQHSSQPTTEFDLFGPTR
jgi:hypothetical protein